MISNTPPRPPARGASAADSASAVDALIAVMTLAEKVEMVSGERFVAGFQAGKGRPFAEPYRTAGGGERLRLEPLCFTDGPLPGYRPLDEAGADAAYPFGFGRSCVTFGYRSLKARLTAA